MANSTNTAQRIADTISHALQLRDEQFYWIGILETTSEKRWIVRKKRHNTRWGCWQKIYLQLMIKSRVKIGRVG